MSKEIDKIERLLNIYRTSNIRPPSMIKINQVMLEKIKSEIEELNMLSRAEPEYITADAMIMGIPVKIDPMVPDDEIWIISPEFPDGQKIPPL